MSNSSVDRYKRICSMNIPPAVKQAAMSALIRHANIMADYVKQAAPEKEGTGKLRASVRVESNEGLLRVTVQAGGSSTTEHGYDHALAQEFGTVKMHAHPFFWPIYRLTRKSRRRAVKSAMSKALKKEFHD